MNRQDWMKGLARRYTGKCGHVFYASITEEAGAAEIENQECWRCYRQANRKQTPVLGASVSEGIA